MKRHIFIISLALLTLQAFAQHDEQVTVEGKYRPKVNKVQSSKPIFSNVEGSAPDIIESS